MKSLLYILSAGFLLLMAVWAYQENYRTQSVLREVERLQGEIGALREQRGMLRAEWAFLTRPERLRDLADLNYDRLGLLPLQSTQFGAVDQVTYPAPPAPPPDPLSRMALSEDGEQFP